MAVGDKLVTLDGLKAVYQELNGNTNDLKSAVDSVEGVLFTNSQYLRKGYINSSGVWKSVTSSTMGHRIYPVKPGDIVYVTANSSENTNIMVLTSDSAPVADAQAPLTTDPEFVGGNITKGTTGGPYEMPFDAKFIYLNTRYTDAALPVNVIINGRNVMKPVFEDANDYTDKAVQYAKDDMETSVSAAISAYDAGINAKEFAKNTKNYYTLFDKTDLAVGSLNSSGEYVSNNQYRIATPNIMTAKTDMIINPLGSYAIVAYLFENGTKTAKLDPGAGYPVRISAGQQYRLFIRKSPESTTAVTVDDMYKLINVYNPIQYIDAICKTGDAEYVKADYGLLPQGVFYAGSDDDTYDLFSYDTTTAEVIAAFDALLPAQTSNTDYIQKTDMGVCSDGIQHVWMYTLSPNQASVGAVYESIPTVFIVCGQHGYEKASVFSLYYLVKHMLTNADDPVLSYLRNHCRIVMIPVANPSGFDAKMYKNSNGVNLNRNWDTDGWGQQSGGDDPDSNDYAGAEPFDQPETAAIRDAFSAIADSVCLAIDYHTNGRTAISNLNAVNDILYRNLYYPLWKSFKKAVRYHLRDITSHLKAQYNLNADDNKIFGTVITDSSNGGTANDWFRDHNKISCTFETFPGLPGGSIYTPDVIRISEELITNFIITVFNYIK